MPKPVTLTTPSDREIAISRTFDAPAALVWDAHTDPVLLRRWMLGPPGWSMPVCDIDLRVGGRYRYEWRSDADGSQFGTGGEYREIVPGRRMVHTEQMDGMPGEALCTFELAERGGRTTLTYTMLFPTTEARDAALESGMSDGMAAGYDRLEGEILHNAPTR